MRQCHCRTAACRNRVARFEEQALVLDGGINWNISSFQGLRVKLQALGLGARLRQALQVQASGRAAVTDDPVVTDFSLRKRGFQIAHRYELVALSYL